MEEKIIKELKGHSGSKIYLMREDREDVDHVFIRKYRKKFRTTIKSLLRILSCTHNLSEE